MVAPGVGVFLQQLGQFVGDDVDLVSALDASVDPALDGGVVAEEEFGGLLVVVARDQQPLVRSEQAELLQLALVVGFDLEALVDVGRFEVGHHLVDQRLIGAVSHGRLDAPAAGVFLL